MLVAEKRGHDETVTQFGGRGLRFAGKVKNRIAHEFVHRFAASTKYPRSLGFFGTPGLVNYINNSDADVVNLHWIGGEFLAIRQIGKIRKPVVWTLHDMWAFCGTEHYSSESADAPWRIPLDGGSNAYRFERAVIRRKHSCWRRKFHLVSPSRWLSGLVAASSLLRSHPTSTIPNPLSLATFTPARGNRGEFGLPENRKIVLFGSMGDDSDGRKGLDLLVQALEVAARKDRGLHFATFGQSTQRAGSTQVQALGKITDERKLARLYNSVDVMVVPSRMDNLPQTAVEAQCCGCPVVAFAVGGLPEIVVHNRTGYLARPFDTSDLAAGIAHWTAPASTATAQLKSEAARRAEDLWGRGATVDPYLALYREAFHQNGIL